VFVCALHTWRVCVRACACACMLHCTHCLLWQLLALHISLFSSLQKAKVNWPYSPVSSAFLKLVPAPLHLALSLLVISLLFRSHHHHHRHHHASSCVQVPDMAVFAEVIRHHHASLHALHTAKKKSKPFALFLKARIPVARSSCSCQEVRGGGGGARLALNECFRRQRRSKAELPTSLSCHTNVSPNIRHSSWCL